MGLFRVPVYTGISVLGGMPHKQGVYLFYHGKVSQLYGEKAYRQCQASVFLYTMDPETIQIHWEKVI